MRFRLCCLALVWALTGTTASQAQGWQKVYPPTPQAGRWSGVTKVPGPGGGWYVAGDGMILRSSDLRTFTTELSSPGTNWQGITTRRVIEVGYAVLAAGGSKLAVSLSSGGFVVSTLPNAVTSAAGIVCHPTIIDGDCVIAAGDQILFGPPGSFFARNANIANNNANFANGQFFVTGYGGGVSAWDGAFWVDSVASFADVYDVAFGPDGNGGEHYVTFGDAGAIALSSDLSNWNYTQPLGLFYAKSIMYAEGRFQAIGEYLNGPTTSVAESADGINWISGTVLPGASRMWDIQFIDGTYVAVGDNREIWVQFPDPLLADGFE
jgi:hypothetical protein